MRLTIKSWNICRGGNQDPYGRPDPRWPGIAERLREDDPDVIFFQEAGAFRNPERLAAVKRDFPGMDVLIPPTPRPTSSVAGNAIAYRVDLLSLKYWDIGLSTATMYGFGVATFAVPGLAVPLSLSSVHLTPYSALVAAGEAQVILARLFRNGGVGLLGGDINHLPASPEFDPDPDWEAVPSYNRSSRALVGGPPYEGNRIVGQTLQLGDLVDVAPLMAERLGDRTLCRPTARGGIRVDAFHATPALAPAIRRYWTFDRRNDSDHDGIGVEIETDDIDLSQVREFV